MAVDTSCYEKSAIGSDDWHLDRPGTARAMSPADVATLDAAPDIGPQTHGGEANPEQRRGPESWWKG
jgi:hypothetical protein